MNHLYIDKFNVKSNKQCGIFLLTHIHGDHISKIPNAFKYTIHCSKDTKKMLSILRPSIKCKTLKINKPYKFQSNLIIIPLNANHMLGSLMFHITIDHRTILYTGDFRYSQHQKIPKANIVLYDNTFHTQTNLQMLSRKKSAYLLQSWIIKMLSKYDNCYIGIVHIGTMDLLSNINKFKYSIDTKNLSANNIKLLKHMYSDSIEHNSSIIITNGKKLKNRFPLIIPSAMWFSIRDHNKYIHDVIWDSNHKVYRLNYCQHSTYSENLKLFEKVKFTQIIPC